MTTINSGPGLASRVENLLDSGIVDITIDVREHIAGLLEMFRCKDATRMRTCCLIVTSAQKAFLHFVFQTLVSPQCKYYFSIPNQIAMRH